MKFNNDNVYRTTKCFSPQNNDYPGGFPKGFMDWVISHKWWNSRRIYLCSGKITDSSAITVDLNIDVQPDFLCDAGNTPFEDKSFNWIMIDPPYSKELAYNLYGLDFYRSINYYTKEAQRLCDYDGFILTLSYEVPKRIKDCNLIACCGIYQTINVANIRCFTVWRKISQNINNSNNINNMWL